MAAGDRIRKQVLGAALLDDTVLIKRDDANPEPTELIAQEIINVSEAFKKINSGRLTQHALIVLLKDQTGLAGRDIKRVLDACAELAKEYTK